MSKVWCYWKILSPTAIGKETNPVMEIILPLAVLSLSSLPSLFSVKRVHSTSIRKFSLTALAFFIAYGYNECVDMMCVWLI